MTQVKLSISIGKLQTRFTIAIGAVTLCIISPLISYAQTQTRSDVPTLSTDQLIERQIKGGETHPFQLNVKRGEYVRAEVEQKNIDVVVSLFAPDGKLIVEMDGKDGFVWHESVSAIAENSDASFLVKVHAYGTAKQTGNFTIKIAQLRPVQNDDRKHFEAEQHFYQGRKLVLQETPDYQAASIDYDAAAKIWGELEDKHWQAVALLSLALAHNASSKNQLALSMMAQAASLFRQTNDRFGEGKAANGSGLIYSTLGRHEKAVSAYEHSLAIRRELSDKRGEGNTLFNLGSFYLKLEQFEKARGYFELALAIRIAGNERLPESETRRSSCQELWKLI